ncbi:hypothetical protein KAR34_09365 [bacterium]|nr:hypothetical protein [bacterium]
MIKRIVIMLVCLTLNLAYLAFAKPEKVGLGINYSVVKIDNLSINSSVSMTKLVNLPLIVTNGGERDIIISMTPRIPLKVQQGYEAIPDPSWVVPGQERLLVPAGSQASMDVIVNIPNDKNLLKRKFHVAIHVGVAEDLDNHKGVVIDLSVTGKLLFSIAPVPNQKALEYALENPADAAFEFSYPRLDFYGIKPGDSFEVKEKLGEPLYLENRTSKKQTYYIYTKSAAKIDFRVDAGTQTTMNPNDVKIPTDELKIKAGKKASLDLTIHVPKSVDFSKGKILYVLSCKSGHRQGVERQLLIYCSRETKEDTKKKNLDTPKM